MNPKLIDATLTWLFDILFMIPAENRLRRWSCGSFQVDLTFGNNFNAIKVSIGEAMGANDGMVAVVEVEMWAGDEWGDVEERAGVKVGGYALISSEALM